MYEAPKLNIVGQAEEVVRGAYAFGYDSDGTLIMPVTEFLSDNEEE
ncbi:MAG TPA: hypothetical protein VLY04_20570 [Bryobacteraceae bacterium]|nr:hypothetical protein [Bryobacteraceae bacterium]